jgi:AbrB family looped-hinge helix DNA binding protein
MTSFATVTSEGQITVPFDVRAHLGLREGDRVEFLIENGVTVLRRCGEEENPFDDFIGIFGKLTGDKDDVTRWVRNLRDDEGTSPGAGLII